MRLAILTEETVSKLKPGVYELSIFELNVNNPHFLDERMKMQLNKGRYRDETAQTKVLALKILDDVRGLRELANEVASMYGGALETQVVGYQVEVRFKPEMAIRLLHEYF